MIEKLTDGLARDWAGFLRDWDRTLRAGTYPETTRYNYLLAAAQLAQYLREHSPDPDADDAAADPTAVTKAHVEAFQAFRGVHRESGLSLDFLYSNDIVRSRIEHARSAQSGRTVPSPRAASGDSSDGTVIRVLTNQLQAAKRAHRREADQLRQQLATATGEILVLRERVRGLETRMVGEPADA